VTNILRPVAISFALGCIVLIGSCKNNTESASPAQYRERLEASGKAAAAITASITQELKTAYAGKAPPSINVHVGDITLVGFDEAIDAEEWGMRETNIENTGAKPTGLTPEKAAALNNSQDPNGNRTISRKVNLKKTGTVIILTEESTPANASKQTATSKTKTPQGNR
jgi:hypothetical protein